MKIALYLDEDSQDSVLIRALRFARGRRHRGVGSRHEREVG